MREGARCGFRNTGPEGWSDRVRSYRDLDPRDRGVRVC
ncbi:hypothetical protein J2S66_007399 [Saccharothrix longispora]|uniref:Uncharacterized protein n=1 Tax=Saccharothrix longispora TaxID=33920 RepID=A0ABU1Q7Y8_9PSEU|nr:hypothetical protein [Saccharothrix longispora]